MNLRLIRFNRLCELLVGLALATGIIFFVVVKSPSLDRVKQVKYRHRIMTSSDLGQHIAFYERRTRTNPDGALDIALLASLYVQQAKSTGDATWFGKASQAAKKSLRLLPMSNVPAKSVLASVAAAEHRFEDAIRLSQEVLTFQPQSVGARVTLTSSYLALGDLNQASIQADQLVDSRRNLEAFAWRGLVLAAQGRDQEAVHDLNRAISAEDLGEVQESAWVRSVLARLYLRRGKVEEAKELLSEALRISPGYHLALSLMGELEAEDGHYPLAEKYYQDAFRSSKQLAYLVGYAGVKSMSGQAGSARELLNEVEKMTRDELKSGNIGHRLELAKILLDRDGAAAAQEGLSLARQEWALRKNVETRYVLSKALMKNSFWSDARNEIQSVLRTGVLDREYFRLASVIERGLQDPQRSEFYFKMALNEGPAFD